MIRITLMEMILRTIPEGILIAFAIYVFSGKNLDKKKIFISGTIFGISAYLIRLLPISFGIHTILLIMTYIVVCIFYFRIRLVKAISSSILPLLILTFCEMLNFIVLTELFNSSKKVIFNNPLKKTLFGYPSIILFLIIIYSLYKLKYSKNREN